jgi:uncharacterized phage infection (PIP) family protein YhgE
MDDDERHPLLDEIRHGLGNSSEQAQQPNSGASLNPVSQGNNSSEIKQASQAPASPEIKQFSAYSQENNAPDLGDKTKNEMAKILSELKQKMADIDSLKLDLERKRFQIEKATPRKTERILQEIKVPPLEMLK